MKLKTTLVALAILIVSCCTIFVAGCCNKVNIGTLESNYKTLQEIYTKAVEDEVFKEQAVDDSASGTKYYIEFGEVLQNKIDENAPGYVELRNLYNVTFTISNEFVDNTINWILGRKDEAISKQTQSAVEVLNSALVNYTSKLRNFLSKRVDLVYYFQNEAHRYSDKDNLSTITIFNERTYSPMINANVEFSIALANAIETTNVYDDINNSEPTTHDCNSIKQYIRAKLLKVFSKFKITEIDSKFNWANTQSDGPAKADIQKLLDKLDENFTQFKSILTTQTTPRKVSQEEINTLWKYTQDFLFETNDYYTALEKLNLNAFNAARFKYDEYDKQAPLYMDKIEQYLNISLPRFLEEINTILYEKGE